jgi:transposase-like protein
MIYYQKVNCRYCKSEEVVKNGHRSNGSQRLRCSTCSKSFQLDYTYNAHKPGVKEQMVEQTLNSSGVSAISWNLKIAKRTVTGDLKKEAPGSEPVLVEPKGSRSISKSSLLYQQ